jgi:hypothetical protein
MVVFLAGAGIVTAVNVYQWFFTRKARARRALKRHRRTAMRNVRDGEPCKVVGRLEYAEAPMVAPFSARQCAGYSVHVYDNSGDGGMTLLREDRSGDFFVRDEDGTCALVRGASARVVITNDKHFQSLAPLTWMWPKLEKPPPRVEEFLRARGKSMEGLMFTKTLRFDEGVLEAGELVSVAGVGRWEINSDPRAAGSGYREAPKLLVICSSPEAPLFISDDPDTTT